MPSDMLNKAFGLYDFYNMLVIAQNKIGQPKELFVDIAFKIINAQLLG